MTINKHTTQGRKYGARKPWTNQLTWILRLYYIYSSYRFLATQFVGFAPEEVGQHAAKHHGYRTPDSTCSFINLLTDVQ